MAKSSKPYPQTCASCRHFDLANINDEAGYCRRYPPKVVVIDGESSSALPVVLPDDWCGEFGGTLQ